MKYHFLICSERSGSNLVTKILDGHSRICGPGPTHLLRYFLPIEANYGDFVGNENNWQNLVQDVWEFLDGKISAWKTNCSLDQLLSVGDRSVLGLFRYIYQKEAVSHKKDVLFVKENHAYRLMPVLLSNFMNSRFIWSARDPRDMALSWKKEPVLRGDVIRAASVWKEDQKQSLFLYRLLHKSGTMLHVRYEDLLLNQEEVVASICEHLGVDFEYEMLNTAKSTSGHTNARASVSWSNLGKPIMMQNSAKYKEELTKEEILYIEYICRDEMVALGYLPEFDKMTASQFAEIQYNLQLVERYEKHEYSLIPEEERIKRSRWTEIVNRVQNRRLM